MLGVKPYFVVDRRVTRGAVTFFSPVFKILMDVLIGFTFSVIGKSTGLRVSPPVMHEAPGTAVILKAKGMEAEGVRCAIERVLKIQN